MKPNKYIQNSDYLSLGQIERVSFSVNFSSVTIPTYGIQTQSYTYNVGSDKGSIIHTQMRYDGGSWSNCNTYQWARDNELGPPYSAKIRDVYLFKSTNTQITVHATCIDMTTGYPVTVPACTVDFVVTFFKPPNT